MRTGRTEHEERGIERGHRTHDRSREILVARRHVVQRAMGLDVLQAHTFGGGHAGYGSNLIQHEIFGL